MQLWRLLHTRGTTLYAMYAKTTSTVRRQAVETTMPFNDQAQMNLAIQTKNLEQHLCDPGTSQCW